MKSLKRRLTKVIDLRCGDCLELMKQIPDESIDLIVTDCPYKIVAGGVTIEERKDECSGVLRKRAILVK